MDKRYEYIFEYHRTIGDRLKEGWEPVPHVPVVTVPPGSVATSSVYVFLRREL